MDEQVRIVPETNDHGTVEGPSASELVKASLKESNPLHQKLYTLDQYVTKILPSMHTTLNENQHYIQQVMEHCRTQHHLMAEKLIKANESTMKDEEEENKLMQETIQETREYLKQVLVHIAQNIHGTSSHLTQFIVSQMSEVEVLESKVGRMQHQLRMLRNRYVNSKNHSMDAKSKELYPSTNEPLRIIMKDSEKPLHTKPMPAYERRGIAEELAQLADHSRIRSTPQISACKSRMASPKSDVKYLNGRIASLGLDTEKTTTQEPSKESEVLGQKLVACDAPPPSFDQRSESFAALENSYNERPSNQVGKKHKPPKMAPPPVPHSAELVQSTGKPKVPTAPPPPPPPL